MVKLNKGSCVSKIHNSMNDTCCAPSKIDASMHLAATQKSSNHAYVPSQLRCFSVGNESTTIAEQWVSYEAIDAGSAMISNIHHVASNWELRGLISKPSPLLASNAKPLSVKSEEPIVYLQRSYVHSPIPSQMGESLEQSCSFNVRNWDGEIMQISLQSRSFHGSARRKSLLPLALSLELLQTHQLRNAFFNIPCGNNVDVLSLHALLKVADAELGLGVVNGVLTSKFASHKLDAMPVYADIGPSSAQNAPLVANKTLLASKLLRGETKSTTMQVESSYGSVVITGGMGALGQIVAAWVKNKNIHRPLRLTLLGRNIRSSFKTEPLGLGDQEVILTQRDISSSSDDCILEDRDRTCIYHASGGLKDAALQKQSLSHLRDAFSPKIISSLDFSSAIIHSRLIGWVNFSSIASLFGNLGQANYAAANGALDGISIALSFQGLPVESLQWGPWAGAGMAIKQPGVQQRMESMGIKLIPPATGLLLLETALSLFIPLIAAVKVAHWEQMLSKTQQRMQLYADLFNMEPELRISLPSEKPKPFKVQTAYSQANKREVEYAIKSIAEKIIGGALANADIAFMAVGLDSVGTLEMANALSSSFDIELAATAIFNYPTVSQLSEHIISLKWAMHSAESKSHLETIEENIIRIVALLLGKPIILTEPFMQAGLDSMGATELQKAIEAEYNIDLAPTVAYDYPTVEALAKYVMISTTEIDDLTNGLGLVIQRNASHLDLTRKNSMIGFVSLACTYPDSLNPGQAISQMVSGRDVQRTVPSSRWDIESVYHPSGGERRMYVRFGGWISDHDAFDAAIFKLSPR